jgi:hypothetical protein
MFVIWNQNNKTLGLVSSCLSVTLAIVELMVACINFGAWCKKFFNYLDIYQYLSIPALTLMIIYKDLDTSEVVPNLLVNLTLLLSGIRALSGLRVLDRVRFMISMLLQVFLDMIGFVIVLLCSILLFSMIAVNIKLTTGEERRGAKNFFLTVDYYYNSLYWSWDPINKANASQLIHHYFTSVFLALVMLNILISIVTGTFGKFLEIKEMVATREMIDMLLDSAYLGSYFKNFSCVKKRNERHKRIACLIVKKIEDEDDVKERVELLEDEVKKLGERIKGLEFTADETNENVKKICQALMNKNRSFEELRD